MPYREALRELEEELINQNNNLALFLQTNNNIYSFISRLTTEEQLEILNPIREFLNNKEYNEYDALERRPNTIYYITNEMLEYRSLDDILELHQQIENGELARATLRTIETDKVKMIIFKKGSFLFLYKYNSGKLFKQGWKARFNNEEAVVEKEDSSILVLSKKLPDIIIDVDKRITFILNVTQAEYILQIENLFIGTLNTVSNNLREFDLMRQDTIEEFINQVSGKNNYMRKLHKIQTTQSYQYFHNNIAKIPDVLNQYDLNVNFDEDTGQIIFDEETDVVDVLHLFADDYVKRYISERDDMMK